MPPPFVRASLLAAAALGLSAAGADETPAAPSRRLTLDEAIERALRLNLDLAVERAEVRAKEAAAAGAAGDFDPILKASARDTDSREETASSLGGADLLETRGQAYEAGVSKKIETGATLDLTTTHEKTRTNNRFSTLNPAHETRTSLTVTQPLLRGFGTAVNRAPREIARRERDAARHALTVRLTDTVRSVEEAYWDLAAAIEEIGVQRKALDAARALEEANRAKVEAGALPRTDLLAAASAVASREADLADAERRMRDAEDALRRLVQGPLSARDAAALAAWTAPLAPADPLPPVPDVLADEDAAILRALEVRPEIVRARAAVEAARLSGQLARDALKPNLSVSGSWSHQRLEASRHDALRGLEDDRARTWEAEVSIEIPLGNNKAEGDLAAAEARLAQETARLRILEQTIAVEVREALRALTWTRRRLAAQERAAALAAENLRAEQLRREQGLSATHDVLEALAESAREEGRLIAARVDLLKALAAWRAAQGTLLSERGVSVE